MASKSTTPPPSEILFLYDSTGKILWVNTTIPPHTVAKVVGQFAWHALAGRDAEQCRSALMLCVATGEPQVIESNVHPLGIWRTRFYAAKKVGKIRVVGVARKFPEDVLRLTDRERQVCKLLADGLSSKAIAARLRVTRSTIDNHRTHVAHKVGISTGALVAWCGQHLEWF